MLESLTAGRAMDMIDNSTRRQIRRGLLSADARMRAECVDALASLADVPGLFAALRVPDGYVRARAASALSNVPGLRVTWRLARLLRDRNPDVRGAVARGLARRGGWLAARMLARLATDGHSVVRYTALTSLAQTDWERARPLLLAAVSRETEGWIRDAAAALLQSHDAPGRHRAAPPASSNSTHKRWSMTLTAPKAR